MMTNNEDGQTVTHGVPIVGSRGSVLSRLADRMPPNHLEAEQGVIGAMLIDEEGAITDRIMKILNPEDMYLDDHRTILSAMKRMHDAGIPIDLVTLADELGDARYKEVGGDRYMEEIIIKIPHAANGAYHADIVREHAVARAHINAGIEMVKDGYSQQFTATELVERATERILSIEPGPPDEEEDDSWGVPHHRMSDGAFRGLVGNVVESILPQTETCGEALALQFLVAVGNLVGVNPHSFVGPTPHRCNLFHCLVGPSGCGKGLGWDGIEWLLEKVNPDFTAKPFLSGMTSGEGVIMEAKELSGSVLAVETEFARTLVNMNREGNTLNSILRQGFESSRMRIPTKNNPIIVEGVHLSINAHIPPIELKGKLSPTDIENGLVNRFLWGGAYMSKLLPDGGDFECVRQSLDPFFLPILDAVRFAKEMKWPFVRDAKAKAVWKEVYPSLRIRPPGTFGAATSRASAITLRLSMIYAILDQCSEIRVHHLDSALAVWTYCEETARTLFGEGVQDKKTAKLVDALDGAFDGLNRQQIIRQVFKNHITKAELDRVLDAAKTTGQIVYTAKSSTCTNGGVWMHRKYLRDANFANFAN